MPFERWKPDLSFQTLPKILWEEVEPTPIAQAKLAAISNSCRIALGLTAATCQSAEFLRWLNGEVRRPGDQRISTRYAGHQFGHWAGQLGDGRAISLAEFLVEHQRWEIQTKGSGLTPFSRMGDGKAVIRSSVREFLCSEFMHGLGIPTTQALALLVGEDPVQRETIERSAIVARVFPSNLRFGHFEYCFHFKEKAALLALIEYTRKHFYPNVANDEEMFAEIVRRKAVLMAQWMAVGFCHGVMNTDNFSILGLTIDYGPFGFLETTERNYICNHSDDRGRYSYQNQPSIALWNLEKLAVCFLDAVEREKLLAILQSFPGQFRQEWLKNFSQKIGLQNPHEKDDQLLHELFVAMETDRLDFTYFFRSLSTKPLAELKEQFRSPGIRAWWNSYAERLGLETSTLAERQQRMQQVNPQLVLKNFLAQEIIADVEGGNFSSLQKWLAILANPYAEHAGLERYAGPTPPEVGICEVSCSS
jgi:uncharacterized protein YdiU (UPF0061 family)